jgi:peptide/nickel transport system permease protein
VLIYIVRRLAWALILFFVITLITFVMFFLLPADSRNAQRNEQGFATGLQTNYNTRGTFVHQYFGYLSHIVRGDLGHSVRTSKPVATELRDTVSVTFSLILGGMVMCLLIALPIGLLSALRPRSLLDRASMLLVLIAVSCQPFWLGLMLSYLLGVKAKVFPVGGYCNFTNPEVSTNLCGGPKNWAFHMILPWITFAALFTAFYARMIRASLLEQFNEDYVRTARAKGASSRRILRAHVLRNASLPVITMLGMDVGVAFAGALFIETAFTLPGMGSLLVRALANADAPVILGIVLAVSFAVVIANLIVDVLYSILDPRIRLYGSSDSVKVSRKTVRELRRMRPQQAAEPASPT